MTPTLKHIYKAFPSQKKCVEFLEGVLWPEGVRCPYCPSNSISQLASEDRYHCNICNASFSVTVQTVFHKTKCDLQKWFLAILLDAQGADKMSVRELADKLETTKDTAWRISAQIKKHRASIEAIAEKLIKATNNEK